MTSVARKPRVHKPARVESWQLLKKPIWPCTLLPDGAAGLLAINGVLYRLRPLVPGGYELLNVHNGKVYHVDTSREPWGCSCPDHIWRREQIDERGCKHVQSLLAALKQLWNGGDVQP